MDDPSNGPTALDWARAQASDLYNTGKEMVGIDTGGYKPFANTMEVAKRAPHVSAPATFDQRFSPATQEAITQADSLMKRGLISPQQYSEFLNKLGLMSQQAPAASQ